MAFIELGSIVILLSSKCTVPPISSKSAFNVQASDISGIPSIVTGESAKIDAGINATKIIKEQNPATKIIMLTIHDDADIIFNSYVAGAMDFMLKNSSVVKIIKSIRDVHANSLQMRAEVAEKILNEMARLKSENSSMLYMTNLVSKLTNTEIEILKLVYRGYKYKQIAQMRGVEEATVRTHVNHILTKLEFKNMKEVIRTLESLGVMECFKNI